MVSGLLIPRSGIVALFGQGCNEAVLIGMRRGRVFVLRPLNFTLCSVRHPPASLLGEHPGIRNSLFTCNVRYSDIHIITIIAFSLSTE